jgi:HEAT repeat protein
MTMDRSEQIEELLSTLRSDNLEERLTAIQVLGEIGTERALGALRERMKVVSREHYALYVAIGKLKRKLHVR